MKTMIAAAALVAASSVASATTTYYGEDINPGQSLAGMVNAQAARAAFLSQLVGVGTENFEGFAAGNGAPFTPPAQNINFGVAGTATLNSSSGQTSVYNFAGAGRFATSGSQYLEANGGGDFFVTFSSAVAAFGFYGTDIGDFGNTLSLRFTRTDNTTFTISANNTLNQSDTGLFFGIIASAGDQFTKVEFLNNPNGDDFFGFDDLTVGSLQQVVPLPSAAGLGFVGLAGLAARRRRAN